MRPTPRCVSTSRSAQVVITSSPPQQQLPAVQQIARRRWPRAPRWRTPFSVVAGRGSGAPRPSTSPGRSRTKSPTRSRQVGLGHAPRSAPRRRAARRRPARRPSGIAAEEQRRRLLDRAEHLRAVHDRHDLPGERAAGPAGAGGIDRRGSATIASISSTGTRVRRRSIAATSASSTCMKYWKSWYGEVVGRIEPQRPARRSCRTSGRRPAPAAAR